MSDTTPHNGAPADTKEGRAYQAAYTNAWVAASNVLASSMKAGRPIFPEVQGTNYGDAARDAITDIMRMITGDDTWNLSLSGRGTPIINEMFRAATIDAAIVWHPLMEEGE